AVCVCGCSVSFGKRETFMSETYRTADVWSTGWAQVVQALEERQHGARPKAGDSDRGHGAADPSTRSGRRIRGAARADDSSGQPSGRRARDLPSTTGGEHLPADGQPGALLEG